MEWLLAHPYLTFWGWCWSWLMIAIAITCRHSTSFSEDDE